MIQGSLDRPAQVEAGGQDVGSHALPLCPLSDGQRLPVPSQEFRQPSVSDLGCPGNPSAIDGLVVAVIVDPVEFVLGRPSTHVVKEGHNGVSPALADGDSARSVVLVGLAPRVETTLDHHLPYLVLGRVPKPVPLLFHGGDCNTLKGAATYVDTPPIALGG